MSAGPSSQTYVIKAGDTLSKVAKRFGLTLEELLAANKDTITNPDKIAIGDEIVIPTKAPDVINDASPGLLSLVGGRLTAPGCDGLGRRRS